jgi:hypothetical protein
MVAVGISLQVASCQTGVFVNMMLLFGLDLLMLMQSDERL